MAGRAVELSESFEKPSLLSKPVAIKAYFVELKDSILRLKEL